MIKHDIVTFHNQTLHDHNFNKICIQIKCLPDANEHAESTERNNQRAVKKHHKVKLFTS